MTSDTLTDIDAEECVVGACLTTPQACERALGLLTPADFGHPHLASAFAACGRLWGRGEPVDPITVSAEVQAMGVAWLEAGMDLLAWQSDVPSPAAVASYAAVVHRNAVRRRLWRLGANLVHEAQESANDPGILVEQAQADLAAIGSPALGSSPGDVDVSEFIAEPDEAEAPEVIPGLMHRDDRLIIVAGEGRGKSEFIRQLVVLPSHGIHPLHFYAIEPQPVLIVDLENPRAHVRSRLRYLTGVCRSQSRDSAPSALWLRPGGIDLRRRPDRVALEDVLRRRSPTIVALGPVYKAYHRQASESDEQVAAEVQAILDDLRTRFSFALILEHHAPQGKDGVRDFRPFGSSLWLRWPECGLKLVANEDDGFTVGRWRGDRVAADWPEELRRGAPWPWVGRFGNEAI